MGGGRLEDEEEHKGFWDWEDQEKRMILTRRRIGMVGGGEDEQNMEEEGEDNKRNAEKHSEDQGCKEDDADEKYEEAPWPLGPVLGGFGAS